MEPEGSLPHFQETASCPYPELLIQSMLPHPNYRSSMLVLFSHLCLGLPSGLLPLGFSTKTLYALLLSPIRATCPAHLIIHDLIALIFGEEYRLLSSSLCMFLHSPVTLYHSGPNIFLSTIISNTVSLCSFLSAKAKFDTHT